MTIADAAGLIVEIIWFSPIVYAIVYGIWNRRDDRVAMFNILCAIGVFLFLAMLFLNAKIADAKGYRSYKPRVTLVRGRARKLRHTRKCSEYRACYSKGQKY